MLTLLNFFKKYSNYFFYLFIYLLFLGFVNLIFLNEEVVLCIALIIYFVSIFSMLRKFILVFFYLESEALFSLFFVIIGLNILYIQLFIKYLTSIFNTHFFLNNIKIYNKFFLFIKKFKLIFLYNILDIFRFKDNFKFKNFEVFNSKVLIEIEGLFLPQINSYINNITKDLICSLSTFICSFSTMFLNNYKYKKINLLYVS